MFPHPTSRKIARLQAFSRKLLLMRLTPAWELHRKRADEYANRLASIVEFSDDAIISKDLKGVINSWNAGAQRLFGYTAEEAIGKPITVLIPPERRDEEPGILDRIRRGERIDHYETVRMRKDGSLVDISLTVSPLKNADGKIIGASKIARDISERKREEGRRKLLINELNHRVKNTLASVQSISAETFRGDTGFQRKEFLLTHHPQLALALCMALARCGRRPRSGGGSWRRGRTFD